MASEGEHNGSAGIFKTIHFDLTSFKYPLASAATIAEGVFHHARMDEIKTTVC